MEQVARDKDRPEHGSANAVPLPQYGQGKGRRSWILRLLPVGVLLAGLGFAYLMGWHDYFSLAVLAESRETLKGFVGAHPLMAPLVFAFLYAIAVAFAFPAAWLLTVFGGFLFGWALSSLIVAVAATTGASLLFLAARNACGESLRGRLKGRVARLAHGFERNAFAYLLALRLAPVLPFVLLNIAPALFAVRLRTFVGATFIGILPGVVAYSWLGQGLESALLAAEARGSDLAARDLATPELTIGLTLIALVAVAGAVIKSRRQRHAE
jgi:uncharacterized membrane protein YdjX (TVP38/TMEM64 family)